MISVVQIAPRRFARRHVLVPCIPESRVSPLRFGAMKDATHSYTAGLWLMPLFNVLALAAAIPLYRIVHRK